MSFLRSLSVISLGLGLASAAGSAQQIVHALTGTVRSASAANQPLVIFQDTGKQKTFIGSTDAKARASLQKKLGDETISVDELKAEGAYVIVFYYATRDEETAVALKDLGKGPFTSASGTVTKFDAHNHVITVQDETGAALTFKITGDTVVESGMGVMDGLKFAGQKGDRVRVVASKADDTALFLHQN